MQIRVMIIEDHPLMQEGLAGALSRDPGIEIVGRAGTGEEGIALAAAQKPDVVLLDLHLPDMGGVAMTVAIIRAASAGRASRSDEVVGGAGLTALLISVPLQFAADGALSRAVWWHNLRYAR